MEAVQVLGGYLLDSPAQQPSECPAEAPVRGGAVGCGGEHLEAKRALKVVHPGLRGAEAGYPRVTSIDQHPQPGPFLCASMMRFVRCIAASESGGFCASRGRR